MALRSRQTKVISSKDSLSLRDVTRTLVAHGCINITSELDKKSVTTYPVHGGGFGDIYKGLLKDGTSVAIKCAKHRVELEKNAQDLKFIAREIHAWSKCKHENVLDILGLAQHRGRLATVSPWMSGGTLPDYVLAKPSVDRLELCCQVATGLAYLHQNEVIHGDLKGTNVLVSEEGVAKLADFGNTKLKAQSLRFTTRTSAVYSLRWAAPELLNQAPVSPETDVYALGMTIYETLTGQIPYSEMTDLAVAMEVMIHKRAPRWGNDLSQITPKKALQDLLDRCWDRESSARPRAADVESQLHHVTEDGRRFALDEQISFEEFCELKINGVIRQIEFYNTGRWLTMDDIVLFEVETYDPFMGVHRPWIVVQTAPLISLSDGELRIAIQAFPSHEASGVGHHQRTRHLVSTNELVAITHLKRQLHLWSQYPGVSKHSFCFVVFECMKELFETAEVKNDYSFYLSLYGHIQAELEELKAQFLTYLEVVIDNS